MLLDLFNEILNETSPIYFYIGILLSVFYFDRFQFRLYGRLYENEIFIRKQHEIEIQLLPHEEIIPRLLEMRIWFIRRTKRIEVPDDDEPASFLFTDIIQKQGGKTCKKHLYLLSLKNTVLL